MIRGFIFPAQLRRARGRLVNFGGGEYVTVTRSMVMHVSMGVGTAGLEFVFRLTASDGAQREYSTTPERYVNLTPEIGYLLAPRALSLTPAGRLDRLVVEFIKTADFALDPLPGAHFSTTVTKP